ncbi:glutamate--tRNA ligase [Wolbachia pipientis]|uniref:Glutamate--tRNA ligase n=1 Tax=Wolbachia pipientis TaxID=955 RepID=A0A1E7QKB7_WOLPI|nr:glutamate--tRNA ligase [Wolbachia pipientis]OEY86893.1 glutamate--tRNA ligase [Wolbachia pipientis]
MLTRFAPSPTGYLHVGNIRTALICWLYTRSKNGKFFLRFDDTDIQRSDIKYIESIIEDLRWVGIDWDMQFKQSERFNLYDDVLLQLIKDGYIYECYETKEELEIKRKLQLKQGLPPTYDREALLLTKEKKSQYMQEGRKPHFRFMLNQDEPIKWNDEIKGKIDMKINSISDPVIKREDGNYTYMLPSVVDDIDFNITHIIRGEDHITNTAIQIQLIKALKAKIPVFAHLPLLHFADSKISKRVGGLDVKFIKESGIEPIALDSYLTKLGTSEQVESYIDMQALINSFGITKFSSASLQFNIDEVYKSNSKVLQKMPFEVVAERLSKEGIHSSEFWSFIRNNIGKFSDVIEWWHICQSDLECITTNLDCIPTNKELIQIASYTFPQDNFDQNTLQKWVNAIKQKTDIKTKELFRQLRLILTGKESGPELAKLLVFIGKENIITRLNKAVNAV